MKLGRNEICRCGSGKKYKHCHYEADQAAESKRLAEAASGVADSPEPPVDEEETGADRHRGNPSHRDFGGSKFMRDSPTAGRTGRPSAAANTPRTTRGAQRGG